MRPKGSTVERELARIAHDAHGVVTRAELLRAGITADEIKHRLGSGLLIREYRGVYRVGHRSPSLEARYLAAVRACGNGALLCGRAAAYLYGILKGPVPRPEVMAHTGRDVGGVTTRRCRRLDPRDGTVFRGIPVTTVPRTLVDIAAVLDIDELIRVCHEADVRYRTTPPQVEVVLLRRPRSPGAGKLRRVLWGDVQVSLSKLERGFLERLREEKLPVPETNIVASERRVDCRWREHGVTVELISYRYHHTRYAWEQDHLRAREAYARGDAFREYTWADVFEDSRLMLTELRELLAPGRPG